MSEDKKYTLPELKKKLTEKEKNFCHEYCVDWNAARAAREAGYSENSDRAIGAQNLTKLYIKQYIDFIKNDYEFLCGISKTKQLQELHKIAYSTITHLHDTWITLIEWEQIKKDNPGALDAIESIDIKTEQRSTGEENKSIEVKYVKIKLYSKGAAIAEINKMMGYHEAEKHNINFDPKSVKGITFDK